MADFIFSDHLIQRNKEKVVKVETTTVSPETTLETPPVQETHNFVNLNCIIIIIILCIIIIVLLRKMH